MCIPTNQAYQPCCSPFPPPPPLAIQTRGAGPRLLSARSPVHCMAVCGDTAQQAWQKGLQERKEGPACWDRLPWRYMDGTANTGTTGIMVPAAGQHGQPHGVSGKARQMNLGRSDGSKLSKIKLYCGAMYRNDSDDLLQARCPPAGQGECSARRRGGKTRVKARSARDQQTPQAIICRVVGLSGA